MFDTAWSLIILFALVCLLVNNVMYIIGWYGHGRKNLYANNKYLPPGMFIGFIWIIIFGFLGYSFYLAYTGDPKINKVNGQSLNPRKWNGACYMIVIVSVYCLLYPMLTMFIAEKYVPLLNLVSLFMAGLLSIVVISECLAAFWYTLPLLAWTAYVNFADVMQYSGFLEKYGLVQPGVPVENMMKK